MKNQFRKIAGIPALITLTAVLCAAPLASSAQMWLSSVNGSIGKAISRFENGQSRKHTVKFYRTSRVVPLGWLVDETGSNTRSAWQARLNRDAASIGIPLPINPHDKDGDGVDDAFDKWPNDPSRW